MESTAKISVPASGIHRLAPKAKLFLKSLLLAFVLLFLIRTFIFKACVVPTGSMLKSIQIGDYFFVNRLAYGLDIPFSDTNLFGSMPDRGDIVLFTPPEQEDKVIAWTRDNYIKRVIGVPGDTIEIRNKVLFLNGKKESFSGAIYRDPNVLGTSSPRDQLSQLTVPPGYVFVMGDNRDFSRDSRFWGFLPLDLIQGKAGMIYWSWDKDSSSIRWDRIGTVLN